MTLVTTACASLPTNDQQTVSYALTGTADTVLGKSIDAQRTNNGVGDSNSGMLLLSNGVDAFIARAAIARLAERSIDVQYYLYHNDLSGGLLTAELWHAAERGVRVRLLLDDMGMSGKDQDLAILGAHKNIEIRLFNPFIRGKSRLGQFITRFGSVTRRAHNKAMIADNQLAIIGGRNVGDEYFGANQNLAFGDLDVTITKPGVTEVSAEFDLYWNSSLAYPVETLIKHKVTDENLKDVEKRIVKFYEENKKSEYYKALANSDFLRRAREKKIQFHWGNVTIIYDHPEKILSERDRTELHLAPLLEPYLTSIEKELLVISPYFVPGKEGVEFFTGLEKRGVEVKILTNSLMSNDVSIVHAGYAKYRKKLIKAGVKIYELDKEAIDKEFKREKSRKTREVISGFSGSKTSLHAKYFVMDRKSAFIGSLNIDPRSFIENTEIGAVIESETLAAQLAKGFDEYILQVAFEVKIENSDLVWYRHYPDGRVEKFTKEPHSSWWDRFTLGLMKWLPAESQL